MRIDEVVRPVGGPPECDVTVWGFVLGGECSVWIRYDMLDATDHPNASEATRDGAERVALIERSLLVLLVIGLFVGVIAILKAFTTAICLVPRSRTAAWPLRQALVLRGL